MDTHTTVFYEIEIPETNKAFLTESRYEALDYYKEGCSVFEKHRTYTQPSIKYANLYHCNPTVEQQP